MSDPLERLRQAEQERDDWKQEAKNEGKRVDAALARGDEFESQAHRYREALEAVQDAAQKGMGIQTTNARYGLLVSIESVARAALSASGEPAPNPYREVLERVENLTLTRIQSVDEALRRLETISDLARTALSASEGGRVITTGSTDPDSDADIRATLDRTLPVPASEGEQE